MTRTIRTDYAAVNALGVTLRTFAEADTGKAWVRDNAALHDGLTLEEVSLVARRVYRPRKVSRTSFAIPPMPVAA